MLNARSPLILAVMRPQGRNYTELLVKLPRVVAGERIVIGKPVNTSKPRLNLKELE